MEFISKNFVPTREYVSDSPYFGLKSIQLGDMHTGLPENANLVWDKMINDPKISKCIHILKVRVLGKGVEILPKFSESHPEYENAASIANFCRVLIDELESPLRSTLEQMLDALVYGHKIAEITWKTVNRAGEMYFLPTKIKVKENNLLQFIVDDYKNVLGFGFTSFGSKGNQYKLQKEEKYKIQGTALKGYSIITQDGEYPFLDKDKFMYLTIRPVNNDPRGVSILRPAYNSWKLKQDIYPEYLRYLLMCAIPLLVGATPENEETIKIVKDKDGNIVTDAAGNPEAISSVQALMMALTNARNATAIAVKGGTKVTEIGAGAAAGGGSAFYNAFELLDNNIEDCLLLQTLGTSQGVYQPKASSNNHMSTLDAYIDNIKQQVIDMLVSSIFKPAIINNFGSNYVKYIPSIKLGNSQKRDIAELATSIAALEKVKWFTEDQKIRMDIDMDFPPRQSSSLDSNLTTTESLELNKKILEQDLLQQQIEEKKSAASLNRILELVKLREALTEQVRVKDKNGNEKITSLDRNLEESTIKEINNAISEMSKNLTNNIDKKPETLGRLLDFKKLVEENTGSASEPIIEVNENFYPTKTNIIRFSSRLKKLFNIGSIDF